ncbi:hypothetical protein [Afipia sp. GAS231]|uniref:hypothetical protein n=1 Tax=Afipia sp. GAS231 TaxID=1882747 RepID=UPI00087C261F|nr:hypothetical protein [Afipia sp. GAS231]SDO48692.1 hypothetical protein SAMN05444050_4255 [Afipia sp. GAS231]
MGQYDITLKALLRRECPVFKDRIGIARDAVATTPRLPRIRETEVDFLGKNADGSFIHVELQTRNDPAMALRMFSYLADIAVIAAPHPAGRRKLALPRIQQKVVFVGAGRPDMENFITQPPDFADKFEILDSKTIDGSGLLESGFITDAIFAVICAGGEDPATIRAILRRIAGDPNSPLMGNLTALLVLAEAREIIETVNQEISKMPITVDARNIPFIKNAIDDVAKAAVGALLRAKFPGAAGLDEMLLNVTAENSDEMIVRIVNASSLQEAIGPEFSNRSRTGE